MVKKACKKCKIFIDGNKCPLCDGNEFTESWKGRLYIIDAKNSEIAEKIGIKSKGEYAIKTR